MPSIKMLTDTEKQKIKQKLEEYTTLDEEGDLTRYVTEIVAADDTVEIRFFPTPEQGPVEGIYFEISIYDSVDWKDHNLGSYSADNLRNGGPHYEQLADELESIVQDVTGKRVSFIKEKGSGAFTETLTL